ncbi:hypothetical protein [Enterococcus sp. AZ072]|uniref:hypothetical protein n=1 Tax=unclassified Enterococcus TaxID=2608891 RepID=UPI003D2A30B4
MKKILLGTFVLVFGVLLTACGDTNEEVKSTVESEVNSVLDSSDKAYMQIASKEDFGDGTVELVNSTINVDDNELQFVAEDFDESKTTFVYVANQKVFEEKIRNGKEYSLDITEIDDAHLTDYQPRVQFVQYSDDTEEGDITLFQQLRYKVAE